jgi:Eco57I restriction-modification methylase
MIALTTIRTEGGLLPPDFLQRLTGLQADVPGLAPDSYHLPGEKLNEAASRAWNRLLGMWTAFQSTAEALPAADPATTVTREKWLLPLFAELGYGRLQPAKAIEIDDQSYPVSHAWQHVPMHLVGRNVDLDRRTAGVAGAARTSPHGLVQELLNRRSESLWGFVSNGLKLRVLRDNRSLTRQAYLEFDLAAMMEGQAFSDFVLLWLLCHQSRVEGDPPESCWLEKWATTAREQGTRALDELRDGVETAIQALGRGFLRHPANGTLLENLRSGALDRQDYYRQLLRLVYRLIFLFVAETREVLLVVDPSSRAAQRYRRYYSIARLSELAGQRRGTPHGDLWQSLLVVFRGLSSEHGVPELGLPALGSLLWSDAAAPDIDRCGLANADLLEAIRALGFRVERGLRRPVDWRNLGPEELGSVYESLLELHPEVNIESAAFSLRIAAGHERKTTGSYYTPRSLVECLLDSALDPVIAEATRAPDPTRAILELKVCDPACGSGHFLIAAAHRIAKRLAAVRTGDSEPSPEAVHIALRDVIGHCLYGVDMNPMAVELCKVSLWLEALTPGRPLSFLGHHIQCGNSLLGATPALLQDGVPDAAFDPIEGDDREYCRELKRRNRREREGFRNLFTGEPWERLGDLATGLANLDEIDDSTLDGVRQKEDRYAEIVRSTGYAHGRLWADAWCAAFVWPKTPESRPFTDDLFRTIERNPLAAPEAVRREIESVAKEYNFFHWHLTFPDVFRVPKPGESHAEEPGWIGGFDVLLGNPPWERVKLLEAEWFAERRPDIAMAPNAARRKQLIAALSQEDPPLYRAFRAAVRASEAESAFLRRSGRFPLCGRGDINSYAVFAETFYRIAHARSRCGLIVPSGILTDDTTKLFLKEIQDTHALAQAVDFENNESLFPGVGHGRMRFCLLTLRKDVSTGAARLFFLARSVADLLDGERWFELTAEDAAGINPNSATCPVFLSRRDAEITKSVYRRFTILRRESPENSPWGARIHTVFHMTADAPVLKTAETLQRDGWTADGRTFRRGSKVMFPIIEGKMVTFYDHRAAHIRLNPNAPTRQQQTEDTTDSEKQNPSFFPQAYLWAPADIARERFRDDVRGEWAIAFKRVTSATNWRTMVACVVPDTLAISYTLYLLSVGEHARSYQHCLLAILNSFAYDYFVRQKTMQPSLPIGPVYETVVPTLDTFDRPTPWLPGLSLSTWIAPRVAELVCVSDDLMGVARSIIGRPITFQWNRVRRDLLQAELDAMAMHHYGMTREEVMHILATFPKVRAYDEAAYGEHRTQRLVLDLYDRMHLASQTSQPFETPLDPPPADPRVAHRSEEPRPA